MRYQDFPFEPPTENDAAAAAAADSADSAFGGGCCRFRHRHFSLLGLPALCSTAESEGQGRHMLSVQTNDVRTGNSMVGLVPSSHTLPKQKHSSYFLKESERNPNTGTFKTYSSEGLSDHGKPC